MSSTVFNIENAKFCSPERAAALRDGDGLDGVGQFPAVGDLFRTSLISPALQRPFSRRVRKNTRVHESASLLIYTPYVYMLTHSHGYIHFCITSFVLTESSGLCFWRVLWGQWGISGGRGTGHSRTRMIWIANITDYLNIYAFTYTKQMHRYCELRFAHHCIYIFT